MSCVACDRRRVSTFHQRELLCVGCAVKCFGKNTVAIGFDSLTVTARFGNGSMITDLGKDTFQMRI